MKLALSFALHGWPTTLEFCALRHGVAPQADDHATSSGQLLALLARNTEDIRWISSESGPWL